MSSVETGQMSAVETGQMSAAETGQMSAVETRQMSAIETEVGPKSVQSRPRVECTVYQATLSVLWPFREKPGVYMFCAYIDIFIYI